MWKEIIVICLILSLVFTSGCVQTGQVTDKETEKAALDEIEQEMEQAIEDINLDDLENMIEV